MDEQDADILALLHHLGGATSTDVGRRMWRPADRSALKSADHRARERLEKLVARGYVRKGTNGGAAFYTADGPNIVHGLVTVTVNGKPFVPNPGLAMVAVDGGCVLLLRKV